MDITFSFIIISKSKGKATNSLLALQNVIRPCDEILFATGDHPSKQRNEASLIATKKYLYFLDDDSELSENSLILMIETINSFNFPEVVGGPAIYNFPKTKFHYSIQNVLGSFFGLAFSCSRYNSVGTTRSSTEKELILCNLCVRRDFFLETGGFHNALFPNEENEFLKRIKDKCQILYNPSIVVKRTTTFNFMSFTIKIFNYGSGRCKHFIKRPTHFNLLYLIPSLFLFYCLALPFVSAPEFKILIKIYLLIVITSSLFSFMKNPSSSLFFTLMLFITSHLAYGAGFLFQLLGFKNRIHTQTIFIEKIH